MRQKNRLSQKNKIYSAASYICILLVMVFVLAGCANDSINEGDTSIYYLRSDKAGLYQKAFSYTTTDTENRVYEALKALAEDTKEVGYIKTISNEIQVTDFTISDANLTIYFNRAYSNMDQITEILVRSAIVRTLIQIDGIDTVSFYVSGKPLEDANGDAVGIMTGSTFISDFSSEALLFTELTLYFSSYDGLSLIPEKRDVYYASNVSLERTVIEQLMSGTDYTTSLGVIPSEVRILSVNTTGGTCYINFNEAYSNTLSNVTDNVMVYALVNSLVELPTVNEVVITVNGNTPVFATADLKMNKPLRKNEGIIQNQNATLDNTPASDLIDQIHGGRKQ